MKVGDKVEVLVDKTFTTDVNNSTTTVHITPKWVEGFVICFDAGYETILVECKDTCHRTTIDRIRKKSECEIHKVTTPKCTCEVRKVVNFGCTCEYGKEELRKERAS